jgi:hypothetical protein
MDVKKEKFIGESALTKQPDRRYTLQLKDGAVTNAKIASNAVTADKLNSGAVSWDKLSKYVQQLIKNSEHGGEGGNKEIYTYNGSVDTLPENPQEGDMVFLTEDNKFYTYIEGEWIVKDPTAEALYINTSDGEVYRWKDNALVLLSNSDAVGALSSRVTALEIKAEQAEEDIETLSGKIEKEVVEISSIIENSEGIVIDSSSYTGTDGQVIYLKDRNTFVYKVPGLLRDTYYLNWNSKTDYADGFGNPKKDLLYINLEDNGLYAYIGNPTRVFTKVGGSADEDVDIATDEITIHRNSEGVLMIADTPKDSTNVVGDRYITNNQLPQTQEYTRYHIYKNINTADSGMPDYPLTTITMPKGSKIVPHGALSNIPITGGELSWVHSSDIGMIQYTGKNASTMSDGMVNKAILDKLANSRYNLILDGEYYIDTIYNSDPVYGLVGCLNAVQIHTPFHIKGGAIIGTEHVFNVTAGGALYCEDVTFSKISFNTSHMIHCPVSEEHPEGLKREYDRSGDHATVVVSPDRSIIEAVEFVRCNFKGDEIAEYDSGGVRNLMKNTTFIIGNAEDVCPSDITPYYLWGEHPLIDSNTAGYSISETAYDYADFSPYEDEAVEITGKNVISLDPAEKWIYVFKNTLTGMGKKGTYVKTIKNNGNELEKDSWNDGSDVLIRNNPKQYNYVYTYIVEKHLYRQPTYFLDSSGEYYFIINTTDNEGNYYTANIGEEVHNGKAGYYKLISECIIDGDAQYAEKNGDTPNKYTLVIDSDVEHNRKCDNNGLRSFRMFDCKGHRAGISLCNMQFITTFEVFDCSFTGCYGITFNLGVTNTNMYSGYWAERSCQHKFDNTSFYGADRVIEKKSQNIYTCGILSEGDSIKITNCSFSNMISNRYATYDCYLSCREVIFENNRTKNICSIKNSVNTNLYPQFEWMKSKGGRPNGTKQVRRVYRNNYYENDYNEIRTICNNYLLEVFLEDADDVFNNYVKRCRLLGITSGSKFKEVVIENNKFIAPGGGIVQPKLSETGFNTDKLIVKGNEFDFSSYYPIAWKDLGLERALFHIKTPNNEATIVAITDNVFKCAEDPLNVPLLVVPAKTSNFDINISNNSFYNCNFHIGNISAHSFRKPIICNTAYVQNNNYYNSVSVQSVYNHLGSVSFGTNGAYFRGDNNRIIGSSADTSETIVEYSDFQNKGETARFSKQFEVPTYNGKIILKSKYLCRPLYTYTSGENEGFPIIYDASTHDTSPVISDNPYIDDEQTIPNPDYYVARLYDRSLAFSVTNTRLSSQWAFTVTYTFKGKVKHKKLEYIVNNGTAARATVVRGFDGIVHRIYPFASSATSIEAYDNTSWAGRRSNNNFYMADVGEIPELGLYCYIEVAGGVQVSQAASANTGCIIHFYTTLEGTKNDVDSDIIIEASSCAPCGTFPANAQTLTDFTPMTEFVENGSAVTSEWMSKSINKDYVGSSAIRYMSCMTSKDTGMKVHVGATYYKFNGTAWIEETYSSTGPSIIEVTQAEYDILINGGEVGGMYYDPTAIYLILPESSESNNQSVVTP